MSGLKDELLEQILAMDLSPADKELAFRVGIRISELTVQHLAGQPVEQDLAVVKASMAQLGAGAAAGIGAAGLNVALDLVRQVFQMLWPVVAGGGVASGNPGPVIQAPPA